MATLRIKNINGTWDKIAILGSASAVQEAKAQADRAKDEADRAEREANKFVAGTYYTKTETNNLLNNKANTNHTHTQYLTSIPVANATTLGGIKAGENVTIEPDGTLNLQEQSSIAVGMILPFGSNGDIPAGFLLCNGATVSKTTYPSLFEAIGYTYGGSGNNFNLPNLNDNRFLEGGAEAGQSKEAGLPNIEGSFGGEGYSYINSNGAFFTDGRANNNGTGHTTTSYAPNILIDASRSNSIYGNSDTVQPKSVTVRYIIKAFAGASPSSKDVDITKVANDVNTLASKTDVVSINEWNGDYCIRYANGLQICRGTFTINLGSGASSGYFYGAYFLQPFIETPTILCTPNGAYGEFLVVHTQASSNTYLEGYYKMNSSSHNNDTSVSWLAIGKWK